MHDFECPYCGEEQDWTGDPISEDQSEEVQCGDCDKHFTVTVSYSVNYRTKTADCLNDGKHEWEDSCRAPWIIKKKIGQYCTGCGRKQDRDATAQEIETELAGLENYPSLKVITLGHEPTAPKAAEAREK